MSAIETIERILDTKLVYEDLKFCLVDDYKRPFTINNSMASVNNISDFVNFETLVRNGDLARYAGIGISVQASKVCAVDIDKCVTIPFDVSSINDFALEIIDIFKDFAYIEFSFSGTGIRILFKQPSIDDYSSKYKIKNSYSHLEYYQPNHSNRYVTVTGKYLFNNPLTSNIDYSNVIIEFLEKYMKKLHYEAQQRIEPSTDNRSIDELMKLVKYHYFNSYNFQDLWFTHAPGSGKDESERDYRLIKYIYKHITQDKSKVKEVFEQSEFFKTKDRKHVFKWTRNDHRYFNLVFDNVKRELGGK